MKILVIEPSYGDMSTEIVDLEEYSNLKEDKGLVPAEELVQGYQSYSAYYGEEDLLKAVSENNFVKYAEWRVEHCDMKKFEVKENT